MADEIVEIARYFNVIEGEVACAQLRSADIKAYLKTDNAGGIHPELNFTRGVRLMVLAGDEEQARQVLNADPIDPH
ncbi:MAG: putative signal transducing protein [Acidimicrobiia bacterium]